MKYFVHGGNGQHNSNSGKAAAVGEKGDEKAGAPGLSRPHLVALGCLDFQFSIPAPLLAQCAAQRGQLIGRVSRH